MTTTLDSDDLLTRLSQEELEELTETAIESGQTDPVTAAINGGLGEIKTYIDPDALEAISPEMLQRIWLCLAVPLLYPRRAGAVPEKHAKEQTWAREFLERARQGNLRPGKIEIVNEPSVTATRDKLKGL